jgi:hypothetical protein
MRELVAPCEYDLVCDILPCGFAPETIPFANEFSI